MKKVLKKRIVILLCIAIIISNIFPSLADTIETCTMVNGNDFAITTEKADAETVRMDEPEEDVEEIEEYNEEQEEYEEEPEEDVEEIEEYNEEQEEYEEEPEEDVEEIEEYNEEPEENIEESEENNEEPEENIEESEENNEEPEENIEESVKTTLDSGCKEELEEELEEPSDYRDETEENVEEPKKASQSEISEADEEELCNSIVRGTSSVSNPAMSFNMFGASPGHDVYWYLKDVDGDGEREELHLAGAVPSDPDYGLGDGYSGVGYTGTVYLTSPTRGSLSFDQGMSVTTIIIDNIINPEGSCEGWFSFSDGTVGTYGNVNEIRNLDNINFDSVTNMNSMFQGCKFSSLVWTGTKNLSNVTSMARMFQECKELESFSFAGFENTNNVTDMSFMFNTCTKLERINNLDQLHTDSVTNMRGMFIDCRALKALDLSSFNTGNVTDMSYMFGGLEALESLKVNRFITSNVKDMAGMFQWCSMCSDLISLVRKLDTSNVEDMICMFNGCYKLKSLDLRNFNTANVSDMTMMFAQCFVLESLNISSFNTSSLQSVGQMFYKCNVLESIDFSSFKGRSITYSLNIFQDCGIQHIKVSEEFVSSLDMYNSGLEGTWRSLTTGIGGYDVDTFPTTVADEYVRDDFYDTWIARQNAIRSYSSGGGGGGDGSDAVYRVGWYKDKNGDWFYYQNLLPISGWYKEQADQQWYYFDPVTHVMYTGYHVIDGKLYYFSKYDNNSENWQYVEDRYICFGKCTRSIGSLYVDCAIVLGLKADINGVICDFGNQYGGKVQKMDREPNGALKLYDNNGRSISGYVEYNGGICYVDPLTNTLYVGNRSFLNSLFRFNNDTMLMSPDDI